MSEAKDRLRETKCPHCGGMLLIDLDSGEVMKHTDPKSKAGRKLFDKAIEQIESRHKGMGKAFESAFSNVRDRGKDFDSRFDKLLENVDPNAPPPPNIFDLEDGRIPPPRSFEDDDDGGDEDAAKDRSDS